MTKYLKHNFGLTNKRLIQIFSYISHTLFDIDFKIKIPVMICDLARDHHLCVLKCTWAKIITLN